MKKSFSIVGMTCAHCAMRVKKALEALDGVESARVDETRGLAELQFKSEPPLALLKSAVDEAGYTLTTEIR